MRFFFTIVILLVFSFNLKSQDLYPQMPDVLQQVFCDYVAAESETRYISNSTGQYIGHLIDNKIYGWGYYLSDDDSQTVGQFRQGKHVFGITIMRDIARVGAEDHYVDYNLGTGKIMRIHTRDGDLPLVPPYNPDGLYRFSKITYSNGDVYYGETLNGRRHGYGIYYWANGDFWYGKYEDGYRRGYGALYKTDRRVFCGKWIGDTKVDENQ